MIVADALTAVTHLANKLARDLPRNLDAAALRYAAHQLARALAKPPAPEPLVCAPPRTQSRDRRPGYWAERKRIQRARAKTATPVIAVAVKTPEPL
jgi:hypothetical protein